MLEMSSWHLDLGPKSHKTEIFRRFTCQNCLFKFSLCLSPRLSLSLSLCSGAGAGAGASAGAGSGSGSGSVSGSVEKPKSRKVEKSKG